MRKAGKQDRAIMKITGHKTMSMLQRYDTVDGEDLRRVVDDAPDLDEAVAAELLKFRQVYLGL